MNTVHYQNLKIKQSRYKNSNLYQHTWLPKITVYFCHCQQRTLMYSFIKTWQLTYRRHCFSMNNTKYRKPPSLVVQLPKTKHLLATPFALHFNYLQIGRVYLLRPSLGKDNKNLLPPPCRGAEVERPKSSHPLISLPRAGQVLMHTLVRRIECYPTRSNKRWATRKT